MAKPMKLKGGKVGNVKKLKESFKRGSGGEGVWLKRVGDDGITVRFLTEPDEWIEFFEFYDETAKRYVPVAEGGPEPTPGSRPSKRYLANAINTDDNRVVPLVLPGTVAQTLVKKYEKFGTLLDADYTIDRDGSGMGTTYDVERETPRKMALSKYEELDLMDVLETSLSDAVATIAGGASDDDDDDDDEPVRPSRSGAKRRPAPKVDDDDDEAPWDDDEDEKPVRPRPVKKTLVKKKPKR